MCTSFICLVACQGVREIELHTAQSVMCWYLFSMLFALFIGSNQKPFTNLPLSLFALAVFRGRKEYE